MADETRIPNRRSWRARRIFYALWALIIGVGIGIAGFSYFENLSLADSFYVTTQTITTVGYGDLSPKTRAGRIFATVFMLVSVGTVAYILSSVVQALVQSEIVAAFGARRRNKEVEKLSQHYIVCGAGRVGRRIIYELVRNNLPFVLIEKDEQRLANLTDDGLNVITDDATSESTLKRAGVERARGLVACLSDDASNVYMVLIARDLNPALHIVARAVEEQAESRLIRAGASRVISPIIIGSHRMATALVKPAVADFMESVAAENLDLGFEQVEIAESSIYCNKKLRETNIRSLLNIVIVTVRRRDGANEFNPNGEIELRAGDLLIAIGHPEALTELCAQAEGENLR